MLENTFINKKLPRRFDKETQEKLLIKLKKEKLSKQEKKKIRDKIILNNLALVKFIILKYKNFFDLKNDIDDLTSYGIEGLIFAIDHYKVNEKENINLFSTYIFKCIEGYILNGISKKYGLYNTLFYEFFKAKKIIEKIYEKKYYPSDTEMLNEILDFLINTKKITNNQKQLIYNKEKNKSLYFIESKNYNNDYKFEDKILLKILLKKYREKLIEIINKLDDREKEIIYLKYGFDGNDIKSYNDLGKKYNISRQRIKQIENNSFVKILKMEDKKFFKDYLQLIDENNDI